MHKMIPTWMVVAALVVGGATGAALKDQIVPQAAAQTNETTAVQQYKECLAVSGFANHVAAHFNQGKAPDSGRIVKVPAGWTPIGGGGNSGGIIIMCR